MKRKIVLFLTVVSMLVFALAIAVGAKSVYLEPIPDELKAQNDSFTHFVVFEEQKYFAGSNGTISGLNNSAMEEDMASVGINKSKIGTEYLTRYNFPAYMGDTLITYVNLNAIKSNGYFSNVCGYVQLEGTVSQVHDMNDCVKQLRCIDFGENSQVTNIPNSFARNAKKLASVKNFPRNLTYVGPQAFNECYGAFKGELYLNATTIDNTAFNNAISNVTHLILGPNVKSIGTQALTVVVSGEIPAFYAPADGKAALVSIEFQCDVSEIQFATQGRNSGSFYFPVASARTPYEKLTSIILSHPDNAKYVTENSIFNDFTADGVTILFNDADGLDDYVTANHDFSVLGSIYYERFDQIGTKAMICSKCGAVSNESAKPLFTKLGYSAAEYGDGGMTIGFLVNSEAIAEYEAVTGKTVNYGVFAVTANNIGNNDIFDESGASRTGVIAADITNSGFDIFNLRIVGFTNEQKEIDLAMGAFVGTTKDGVSEYAYLQIGAPEDGAKYFFASYNDVLALLPADEDEVVQ